MNNKNKTNPNRRIGVMERLWKPFTLKLNKNYSYFTKNVLLKILYYIAMFCCMPILILFFFIVYGFRVTGYKNIWKMRNTASVSVSNHVHNMDAPMVTWAFFPEGPYFLAEKQAFEVFFVRHIVRMMRGLPLPKDASNFKEMTNQIVDRLENTNDKVHIYPEGSIVPYSKKLRRFQDGAFYYAVKANVPVLPMVFVSPRKRRIQLMVGEPIEPKTVKTSSDMTEKKQIEELRKYVNDKMQTMMDDFYNK